MESARDATGGTPKFDTLCTLALAAVFFVFFDVTKHNTSLAAVNPFGEDPYDAIGSFGTQAAAFAALLALVRAFLLWRARLPRAESAFWLLRAQMAAALLVLVTMAGNAVGLARHTSLWLGTEAGTRLVALLVGMTVLALALGVRVRVAARRLASANHARLGQRALAVCLLAVIALAFYPEGLRDDLLGELFTVVAGALLLFVPTRALLTALVPEGEAQATGNVPPNGAWWQLGHRLQWALVVIVSLVFGVLIFLAEATGEGFGSNLANVAKLAAIFIGLEAAGVLIGFVALRGPLGLFRPPAPS